VNSNGRCVDPFQHRSATVASASEPHELVEDLSGVRSLSLGNQLAVNVELELARGAFAHGKSGLSVGSNSKRSLCRPAVLDMDMASVFTVCRERNRRSPISG
jgi:hypothetical protein